jgi:two-component system, OmpR family, response regulator VanR
MRENLKKFTLLYAEDDKSVQKEMLEYFESYFKEVYLANDGKEALALYEKNKPDVLILDIYMPNINGLELTEYIRKNDYETKIVLITAYSKDTLMLQAINTNVNYYIIKPATLQKIKEMLDKISMDLDRNSEDVLEFNENIYFNLSSKKLFNQKNEIKLSKKEKDLMEIFSINVNKSITIEDIVVFVWRDYMDEVSIESVKSLVSNLRKKLPKDTISNIYGIGYILKI